MPKISHPPGKVPVDHQELRVVVLVQRLTSASLVWTIRPPITAIWGPVEIQQLELVYTVLAASYNPQLILTFRQICSYISHNLVTSVWNRPGLSRLGVDSNLAKSSRLEFLPNLLHKSTRVESTQSKFSSLKASRLEKTESVPITTCNLQTPMNRLDQSCQSWRSRMSQCCCHSETRGIDLLRARTWTCSSIRKQSRGNLIKFAYRRYACIKS